jgi:RimJ/RimL family protein N-acetyltransferase
MSGKRVLIVYIDIDKIAAYCWLNYGFCKHYSIGSTDVVIGPVMTDEKSRGKGFATRLLKASFNYINKIQMADAVYIDTAEDNYPMQAVIKKCGFGDHVSSYERT